MTTYLTDDDGKFIPSTQRPDGTWRKARRVKDGYVPQEEVPLYESKGKQFAQRKSTLPPGMCPLVAEQTKKEREKQERTKAKKLAKQQENGPATKASISASGHAKKTKHTQSQSQPTPSLLVLPNSGAEKASVPKAYANSNKTTTSSTNSNEAVVKLANDLQATLRVQPDDVHEATKKLKKLRKKLREIETIEQRIKSGELKKPEKDQLDKVKRKKEVITEIKQLEDDEAALGKGKASV